MLTGYNPDNEAHKRLNSILEDMISDGIEKNMAISNLFEAVNWNLSGHSSAWTRFEALVNQLDIEEADARIRDTLCHIAADRIPVKNHITQASA